MCRWVRVTAISSLRTNSRFLLFDRHMRHDSGRLWRFTERMYSQESPRTRRLGKEQHGAFCLYNTESFCHIRKARREQQFQYNTSQNTSHTLKQFGEGSPSRNTSAKSNSTVLHLRAVLSHATTSSTFSWLLHFLSTLTTANDIIEDPV